MDLLENLALGFSVSLSLTNLVYCFIGALIGTLVGVLPGLGPVATIAMLLPVTMSLEPTTALIMLAGIYYGALYGGSTTAILVNLPGEVASAVTAIDGYKMAMSGKAGPALAIAALGSFFAGCVGTLVIALFALPLTQAALMFGSAEYFAIMMLGLVSSVVLARGSLLKSVAMVLTGLAFATIGTDAYTGAQRFTLGFLELADGVDIVSMAVGLFGVAEILRNLDTQIDQRIAIARIGRLMPSREELGASAGPVVRGTLLGSLLGILPGGGAVLSSFASYALEKRLSRSPERFGNGAIEGVAGPEAANNAGAQTSFIPMLTLGIPANGVMALILGALIVQGIQPGPNVAVQRPDLFWAVITSMWIGNLMLVIMNLPLIGIWVSLLRVPYKALFPAIILISAIGTYSINSNLFDLYSIVVFALLGYVLSRFGCEPAPMLLGFVLGSMIEEHFRRALMIAEGDFTVFFTRPISAVLLGVSLLMLLVTALPKISRKREKIFVEE